MSDAVQIPPTKRISVTLEARDWNVVLWHLRKGRYDRVSAVIPSIIQQCMEPPAGEVRKLHPVDNTDEQPPSAPHSVR